MNTNQNLCGKHRRGEKEGLYSHLLPELCFVLYPVNLYLKSSEAETVEQRQSDQTAEDAVDCGDETRCS